MRHTTLGVLITYHNEGALVRECLDSLLDQPQAPDEVLIYDDASDLPPDGFIPAAMSARILRGDVNRGPACGRNVLLRASQSDYIHFHDADDLFRRDWCTRVRAAIADPDIDAIFTEIASWRNNCLITERVVGLDRLCVEYDPVRFCIGGVMLVPAGTYQKSKVLAIGGYRETLWQSEDYDFHIRLFASGIRFAVIDEPLVTIRIRDESRSQNRIETASDMVAAIRMLVNEIDPRYRPDFVERLVEIGSILYQRGDTRGAHQVFKFAYELGKPTFVRRRRFYRLLANLSGPENVERLATVYRHSVPHSIRESFVARGW